MTDNPTLKPCPLCGGPAELWNASERQKFPAWIACMGWCSVLVSKQYKTTSEAVDAWNTRAAPKVKALEWWEPCQRNNQTIGARTILGTYYIHVDGGKHEAWLESSAWDEDEWSGPFRGNLYEAQADAQADFERRILDALE